MKRNPSQPGLFDAMELPLLQAAEQADAGPSKPHEAPWTSLNEADWKRWQGARCTLQGHPAFVRGLGNELAMIEPIALDVEALYTSWAMVEDVMVLFGGDFDRERDEAE
jgi:hypothetical protein